MIIKIKSIDLSYFKGVRNLHINCGDNTVSVCGDNGTGKTTVADAIQWCLFGKNAIGDTKFAIKTLDETGAVIPNVEHSVKMVLVIDERETTIKRVWIEDKVTSRGRETDEIKHHAEFYINGEKYLKKDFDAFMANLIENESVFRAVTSPSYFLSLKWQDQRALLEQLVGKVDTSELVSEYYDVLGQIEAGMSAMEYQKHLGYNIKEIKAKLEQIPSRVDEQRKTMPEEVDEYALAQKVDGLNLQIEEAQQMIANLRNGNNNAKMQSIQRQLDFARRRVENMKVGASNNVTDLQRKKNEKIRKLSQEESELRSNLEGLKNKLHSLSFYVERCEGTLADINDETIKFREEWDKNRNRKVCDEEIDTICPTCGQEIPEDQREEQKQKLIERLNITKAARKKELLAKADKIKERKAEAEAQLAAYREEIEAIDVATAEKKFNELHKSVEEAMAEEVPTMDELLARNESWRDALTSMHEFELQLSGEIVTDNSETIKNLENEITGKRAELSATMLLIGNASVRESHLNRIKELESEQVILNKQLDELMSKQDQIADYLQRCDELLENNVNSMFSIVSFRLFEKLNDGTKKPNCVAWVRTSEGLVPFSDANRAMQINAGRDIINTLSKYYNMYAPVVTDNAECCNEFLPINSQDFRFYVTKHNNLIFSNI